jgi:nitrite reductase (NADH) large subunit
MRLLIVGNGVAGVTTARLVAERDPSAEVTIYSDEPHAYYPRPRLIELLAGRVQPEGMPFYPEDWYVERGLRTVLGHHVAEVQLEAREVALDDGRRAPFDQLVLATGAHCWVPPIPGVEAEGVFALRTMRDALALRDRASQVQHAVVLGGGLLGLDTAMALRAHGIGVTAVELLPRLLPRQLDDEGAALLQRTTEERGVSILTGDACARIERHAGGLRLSLKSGQNLDAGLVVVSAGIRANVDLAREAGLACHNGVLVNERLQTSAPGVYAVGDVAEFGGRIWGIIPAALAQAQVAAAQILGHMDTLYRDIVPSTTLKVTGIDLTSIGEVNPQGDGVVEARQTDPTAGVYRKLVIREGHVVGAIVLGERSSVRAVSQLIARKVDVSAHVSSLLKPGFDLASLL